VLKSITLFVLAALLEIGGAWLVWQGVREHRG
jgi:small multidrug resistance family-3 protein